VNEVDTPPDIVDTPDKACRPFKLWMSPKWHPIPYLVHYIWPEPYEPR
jgi:hypothetical protein